jgi:hypothetical protein
MLFGGQGREQSGQAIHDLGVLAGGSRGGAGGQPGDGGMYRGGGGSGG